MIQPAFGQTVDVDQGIPLRVKPGELIIINDFIA